MLGVWFWHCHLDKHLSWGIETVFIVKNGDTPETNIRDPPAYLPPCRDSFDSGLQEFDDSAGKMRKLDKN